MSLIDEINEENRKNAETALKLKLQREAEAAKLKLQQQSEAAQEAENVRRALQQAKYRRQEQRKKSFLKFTICATVIVYLSVNIFKNYEDRGLFHFVLFSVIFICIGNLMEGDIEERVVSVGGTLGAVYGVYAGHVFCNTIPSDIINGTLNVIFEIPSFAIVYGLSGLLVGYVTKRSLQI